MNRIYSSPAPITFRRLRAWGAMASLCTGLGACAAATSGPPSPPPAETCKAWGTTPYLQVTLMFGMTKPHGGVITEPEWRDFLRTEITPRFPSGLTVQDGQGQWQDRETGRVGSEPSRLVWISTPPEPDLQERLTHIRNRYRSLFDQQSVGLTIVPGCSSF